MKWKRAVQLIKFDEWRRNHIYISLTKTDLSVFPNLLSVYTLCLYSVFSLCLEAHRALELLEDYHAKLTRPQDKQLRLAIERVIRIFKSRLFQALLGKSFYLLCLNFLAFELICVVTHLYRKIN